MIATAIVGSPADTSVLGAMLDCSLGHLNLLAERLEAAKLMLRDGPVALSFPSPLLAEVIIASLEDEQLIELHHGAATDLLLAGTGLITATPLLLFAAAARRIPLFWIGMLQYLAPTGQFLIGVFVYHEALDSSRLGGFALVWSALLLLTLEGIRQRSRRPQG